VANVRAIVDPSALSDEIAEVYQTAMSVFGDGPGIQAARAWAQTTLPRHSSREGFRCFGAFEDGRIVGIIYGYHGERGQYWEDWLHSALDSEIYDQWFVDQFDLVEFHVASGRQGDGIGQQLYEALFTAPFPYRRAVLTTRSGDTRARRFYDKRGWQEIWPRLEQRYDLLGLSLG
jgi:GNAT superfamily N-acetyltransferase